MKLLPKHVVEVWGGMECTVNRVGDAYFDQLDYAGHRERDSDIKLFADLGLKKIRYPILWEYHQPIKDHPINWAITEQKVNELRGNGVEVIAGLVHHGSGPAYAPIQDESFALGLAAYAGKLAEKFPWINYYTPVNEPLTTARFCGLYGHWYPHETNDACFCRILVNECKATSLAMAAIRAINPNAQLIQTDDLIKVHSTPALAYQAAFENHRRWLTFDLLCGRVTPDHALWEYLVENNISIDELNYFTLNPCPPQILGMNYYLTSERYLDERKEHYPVHTHGKNSRHSYADVEAVRVGQIHPDGIEQLLREVWGRYGIPIAVTEVHLHCTREEQMRWLNESWQTANTLSEDGIPILAITPWALLGSHGWDRLLTAAGGTYEPGVFDCSTGYPRPTILAKMIKAFSHHSIVQHPALDHPGWWHRPCRVIYGEKRTDAEVMNGKSLAISGARSALLEDACRLRSLKAVEIADVSFIETDIWATIVVDECMEVSCPGRANLIIRLAGDVHRYINAGLDLLLDGESGYWDIDNNGILCKQIGDTSTAVYF